LDFFGQTHVTTVFREACVGDGPGFENEYWVDGGGTIRRSRELVHPVSGAIRIDLLRQ
jgi:hypothetical protein